MLRPSRTVSFRLREKASVFLAELHPATDAGARAGILQALRRRDFDATHHCSAWREGVPPASWGSDDDGEPAGTAGPPMLRVLEGAGLTDCLAVCVRWYGGTKLGTGGLVRAYTESLQGALAEARTQGVLETVRILRHGEIRVPAGQAHLPFAVLGAFPEAVVESQVHQGELTVVAFALPPEREEAFTRAWRERSRGGSVAWKP